MAIASISRKFGIVVRTRRTAAGLSQEKLAEGAGLHPAYVRMVERAVGNPTLGVSASIARALGVALPRLVEEAQRHAGRARIYNRLTTKNHLRARHLSTRTPPHRP